MARPYYETQHDLSIEQQVIHHLSERWGCSFVKLSIKHGVDFAMQRGTEVAGFCEVKSRSLTMAQIKAYGGYMLSLHKWATAKMLSDASGKPFYLAVNAMDGLYVRPFLGDFKPESVTISGRRDRGDPDDIEPCVLLDTDAFTQFTTRRIGYEETADDFF